MFYFLKYSDEKKDDYKTSGIWNFYYRMRKSFSGAFPYVFGDLVRVIKYIYIVYKINKTFNKLEISIEKHRGHR